MSANRSLFISEDRLPGKFGFPNVRGRSQPPQMRIEPSVVVGKIPKDAGRISLRALHTSLGPLRCDLRIGPDLQRFDSIALRQLGSPGLPTLISFSAISHSGIRAEALLAPYRW